MGPQYWFEPTTTTTTRTRTTTTKIYGVRFFYRIPTVRRPTTVLDVELFFCGRRISLSQTSRPGSSRSYLTGRGDGAVTPSTTTGSRRGRYVELTLFFFFPSPGVETRTKDMCDVTVTYGQQAQFVFPRHTLAIVVQWSRSSTLHAQVSVTYTHMSLLLLSTMLWDYNLLYLLSPPLSPKD